MRVQIAIELKEKIENKLTNPKNKPKVLYTRTVIDDEDERNLLNIALHILNEKSIPSQLDLSMYGKTLFYLLKSRTEQNIGKMELSFIDKSGSLDDFPGFFADPKVRQLYETIAEHLAFCVKKKVC